MKQRYLYIAVAIIALLAAGGWIYWKSSTPTTQTTNTPPASSTSPSQQSTPATPTQPTQQPATYPVSVYFSKHPQSDNDPGKTFAVSRRSPDLGVASYSITELLKGPTNAETSQGYFTTAKLRSAESSCGGDFTLTIKDTVATLTFCRPFDHLGVVADGQAESELKATLLQFPSVKKVIILNQNGDCEFNLSGMNLCKQ